MIALLDSDPWKPVTGTESSFEDNENVPKYIRIEKYRYKFHDGRKDAHGNCEGKTPHWVRERIGRYFPRQGVMTADLLAEIM